MQVKIDSVSDVKTDNNGTSSKIKCGNDYYYVNEDATPLVGQSAEISYEEKTSKKGNKYKIAKILKVLNGAQAVTNGHIPWADYEMMAKMAHGLALSLEPDGVGGLAVEGEHTLTTVDRSSARARILNTIMIAFSNGKIALDTDDIPF